MNALSEQEMSYQQALAAANRFTLEDVATNQGGQISERQRSKLKFSPRIGCFGFLFILGLGLIASTFGDRHVSPALLLTGLLVIGLALFFTRDWYKEWSEGLVESCEGVEALGA